MPIGSRRRPDVHAADRPCLRGGSCDSALDEVEDALALWRGEALEDVAGMEFARGEATRLEELRWVATERRIDLQLLLGRHGEVIGDLSELVQRMPLRERFHEQLVLALYRSGRQGDALRAYGEARRTLVEELGIEPGLALRDLERRVLQQDPSLDWSPPDDAGAAGAGTEVVEPAVSTRGTRGRLPVPVSPLIGRDAQLVRLEQLLDGHRAVTLTGPAGAGKTRLAIEVAARSRRPVCYVDFSPIDDPGLVAPTVAAAAGVTITPGDDPVTSIAETLASRDVLLVLDTCEHVVAAVARLASAVLRRRSRCGGAGDESPSARRLGGVRLAGATAGFAAADAATAAEIISHAAVALFIERAIAVSPDLEVDDPVAADIAAVCVALDGLPLAIELAAARADVLSPAAIRSRLQDRFGLLIDRGRRRRRAPADAARRDRLELRAAVGRSADVLRPPRRLCRHVRPRCRAERRWSTVWRRRWSSWRHWSSSRWSPAPAMTATGCWTRCGPTRWKSSPTSTPTRPATATPLSTCSWPSRVSWRSVGPTSSPGWTASAATSTTSGPRSSGACSLPIPPARPAWPVRWRGSGRSTAC